MLKTEVTDQQALKLLREGGYWKGAVIAKRFLWLLIVTDAWIVAANAAFDVPSFLDLDEERNFTTWYSSAKLLLALWRRCLWRQEPPGPRRGTGRLVWLALALTLGALSMDETATAHERWRPDDEAHGGGKSARPAARR